ncbi:MULTISPECIES: hypothetical protein [unclassified Acinetobacter]|uniref:hypothetical protein n=1 Tax=unclassified Acinetobacter TaxID=196816 RepID=UPI0029352D05|nr:MULTISPECIES: hypothetical protein [unclassified Acinetobacter]WOE32767.1 hypothetical protein QSG84_06225 [Acinetobacter sp. SAAs470]WOE38244.1 hypothetical protein QSG86_15280 [Acinetobacter sp. SAAs474]
MGDLTIEQMHQILDGAPNDATHSKVLLGSVGYYFNSSNDESHQAGLWIDDGDNSYWGLSSYQNWELLLADNGFISLDDLRTAITEHEGSASGFEKYIVAKYPNRSAKVLTHKLEDVDGTMFYACKDVQDQFEVWTHQQSKIEQLENLLSLERHRAKALEVELTNSRNYSDKLHEQIHDAELQIALIKKFTKGLRNEFDLWADDGEGFDAIEAQIEQLENSLRGES